MHYIRYVLICNSIQLFVIFSCWRKASESFIAVTQFELRYHVSVSESFSLSSSLSVFICLSLSLFLCQLFPISHSLTCLTWCCVGFISSCHLYMSDSMLLQNGEYYSSLSHILSLDLKNIYIKSLHKAHCLYTTGVLLA